MFTAALFIIAKVGKTPASTNEYINETGESHTQTYVSAMKRNKVLTHITTWVNLKHMILGKRSQLEKTMYCRIPFI